MSAVARALLTEIGNDQDALAELVALLAPGLLERLDGAAQTGGWLETKAAAQYLGISVDALHRLTAKRALRFSQEHPGPRNRCYFRREDLDAYRKQFMRGGSQS